MQRGFAVASLDFRSSNEAPFLADVFDIKAGAVAFFRDAPVDRVVKFLKHTIG